MCFVPLPVQRRSRSHSHMVRACIGRKGWSTCPPSPLTHIIALPHNRMYAFSHDDHLPGFDPNHMMCATNCYSTLSACSCSGVGTSRPLLTANGTPATTPSSDVQRSLGQSSSNTPASTPTEMQDLQLASPQDQSSETNTYQEIPQHVGNHHAPSHTPRAAPSTVVSHTSQEHASQSTVLSSQAVPPRQLLTVAPAAPPPCVHVPNPPGPRGSDCNSIEH